MDTNKSKPPFTTTDKYYTYKYTKLECVYNLSFKVVMFVVPRKIRQALV